MTTTITVIKPGIEPVTFTISTDQIGRIERMLQSPDGEMKRLGVALFYEMCKIWEYDIHPDFVDDVNFFEYFVQRTLARIRVVNRRYFKRDTIYEG